eukprot:TRINITY_DN7810_c0_g2_i4.p1 TRINITY_DN7810_c0_g2~~TRINITY_DN7810_c0_g2_i4.p1  ORF type:complete len:147 (-),score=15.50 TRINITY_DN7810_c0_g2_i4:110-550(-)
MDKWFRRACVECNLPLSKTQGLAETLCCGHTLCYTCADLLKIKSKYIMCSLCLSITPNEFAPVCPTLLRTSESLCASAESEVTAMTDEHSNLPVLTEMLLRWNIGSDSEISKTVDVFSEAQLVEALNKLRVSEAELQKEGMMTDNN